MTRMGFTRRPILDASGQCMPCGLKACIVLVAQRIWIFPQITLALGGGTVRLDALVYYRGSWYGIEIDGPSHQDKEWDKRRDEALGFPVLRFTSEQIKSLRFASILLERLHLSTKAAA